ncbi:hypothetical protein P22_2659 [Propionispora sp. 2/2-37]|uniref:ArsR/SmtB family transcription factor n=1 Tax=Propionispora sp. 2/2-37 TaxID=1677858 RepID=UPI0006BB989D|nr:metalloregulator ArsR/SmtB family transcription factor [Propionispora sp. 2/2-37]CUH96569.1 hypothetical protein P22_2659 [Propionispora sp. 2/2-37]
MKYVDILKALADVNRLAIMCYLRGGRRCVCEIEPLLNISQSATSKHLTRLRLAGLIEAEKTAQWVYYWIPESVYQQYPFLATLLNEAGAAYQFASDQKKHDC